MLLIAVLTTSALAWEHADREKWDVESLRFSVDPTPIDGLPQTIDPDTKLTYMEESVVAAWCAWKWSDTCDDLLPGRTPTIGAECAEMDFELVPWGEPAEVRFVVSDERWTDEIDFEFGEGGALVGVEVPISGVTEWLDHEASDCDDDQFFLEARLTHDIGHVLGLDHSCEDGEACTDSELAQASMFWNQESCDASAASINDDDINGLTALYGPSATWVSDPPDPFGGVPVEVTYTLVSDYPVAEAVWSFGDGEGDEGEEVAHTYTTQGQFSVTLEYTLESDECGVWTAQERVLGHALACATPEPSFSYVDLGDGLIRTDNLTPMGTYGCVDEVLWEVYQGTDLMGSYGAWEPDIPLPVGIQYTLRLTTAGPGGESTAELEVLSELRTKTCSTAPMAPGVPAALLSLVVFGLIRRREG